MLYMEYEPIFTFVNIRVILFKMGTSAGFDFPHASPLIVVAVPWAVSAHLFFREGRRGRHSVPAPQRLEVRKILSRFDDLFFDSTTRTPATFCDFVDTFCSKTDCFCEKSRHTLSVVLYDADSKCAGRF